MIEPSNNAIRVNVSTHTGSLSLYCSRCQERIKKYPGIFSVPLNDMLTAVNAHGIEKGCVS